MSKVLICISDASDVDNTKVRIVDFNSRAEKLAEVLDDNVVFIDNDALTELLELLENEDTYVSNNLPCEIEQIYSLGVIY